MRPKTQFFVIAALLFSGLALFGQKPIVDAKGLNVGDRAPNFEAENNTGKTYKLSKLLKEGPVVMIFYRGYWCPYCNKHLETLQDSLSVLEKLGARILAISPEKPIYLEEMKEKTGTDIPLLYDDGYKIANAYDVTFTPEKVEVFKYNVVLNAGFEKSHPEGSNDLPIPATYIIGKDGMIKWRHFDPDYKKRSKASDIIEVLKSIQQ